MVCCYQVTEVVSTRYGFAFASSARSSCNFGPLADLAISVFGKMSMNIVFYPIPHVSCRSALKKLHEMNWRESFPVTEFHHPPSFSLNSCNHSGISELSEHNGSPRAVVVSFLLVFGIFLAWSSSGLPELSSTSLDTGTGEMSLLVTSSLSRTDNSPTVGEEGEDEEDDEE